MDDDWKKQVEDCCCWIRRPSEEQKDISKEAKRNETTGLSQNSRDSKDI